MKSVLHLMTGNNKEITSILGWNLQIHFNIKPTSLIPAHGSYENSSNNITAYNSFLPMCPSVQPFINQ